MTSWEVVSASVAETERLGALLGNLLEPPLVILLTGDLGSGKTALVRGVARGLGVPADEPVTSPTFALLNEYQGRCRLHHFDLYRLGGPSEVDELGFDDYLAAPGVTVVEWAERSGWREHEGAVLVDLSCGEHDAERRLVFRVSAGQTPLLQRLAAAWREEPHEGI